MQDLAANEPAAAAADEGLPESYFRELEAAFARAECRAGRTREFLFELAGMKISLQCAGGVLIDRLSASLSHLETTSETPADFSIYCWDARATATEPPLPNGRRIDPFHCLTDLTDHRFRTFCVEQDKILCAVDLAANSAYCCYGDAEALSMDEISGPLRPVFGAILNRNGMHLVRAAAVGFSRGSLLLAGPPGSGKSTLALLALQAGLFFQADDLCVLTSDRQPRSLCLYNIATLPEDAMPRFAPLHPILSHFPAAEKKNAYFYAHRHFPARVLKDARVRALVLPGIGTEPASRLERATPMEAVRALIPWTVRMVPKSDTRGERIMLQALSRFPAYRLHLGQDERSTLAILRSLLDA